MSDSRIKRDMNDSKTILEFMGARDPFSKDSTLRSIVTGVIADNRFSVDKAKEVGQNILKTMTHKNTEEYTSKKDKQAITMDKYMISEVIHKAIQVDPQLLFQRLITARNYANEDVDVLFKHELCAVPASLFEPNGLPRKANKAILAEAIWKVINANVEYPCQLCSMSLMVDPYYSVSCGKEGTNFSQFMTPMYPRLSRSITKQLWFLMDMNMVLHQKMSPTTDEQVCLKV